MNQMSNICSAVLQLSRGVRHSSTTTNGALNFLPDIELINFIRQLRTDSIVVPFLILNFTEFWDFACQSLRGTSMESHCQMHHNVSEIWQGFDWSPFHNTAESSDCVSRPLMASTQGMFFPRQGMFFPRIGCLPSQNLHFRAFLAYSHHVFFTPEFLPSDFVNITRTCHGS